MKDSHKGYLRLLQEYVAVSNDSFEKTGNIQYLSEILGGVGNFKRLKPNLRENIQDSLFRAEEQARRLSSKSLSEFAESIDLTSLDSRLKRLEKLKCSDLRHTEDRTSALLVVDDLLDRRDTVHLALQELSLRGVSIPAAKLSFLQEFDRQASNNEILRWGLSLPRPKTELFESGTLDGLWWWQPSATPVTIPVPSPVQGFLSRFKKWFWPENVRYVQQWAPITAILLVVVGASFYWQATRNTVVVSLRDGSHTITLDKKGTLSGLDAALPPEDTQSLVAALSDPSHLRVPTDELKKINRSVGGPTSMGATDGDSFRLIMPIGTILEDQQPTFSWEPLNAASSYTVAIYQYGGDEVVRSAPLTSSEWKLSSDQVLSGKGTLERGATYIWHVAAIKDGKTSIADKGSKQGPVFMILSEREFQRLQRARGLQSPLLLGTVYAEVGMLAEAEEQFRAVLQANASNPAAEQLLGFVQQSARGIGH